jgi:hypothetical protein
MRLVAPPAESVRHCAGQQRTVRAALEFFINQFGLTVSGPTPQPAGRLMSCGPRQPRNNSPLLEVAYILHINCWPASNICVAGRSAPHCPQAELAVARRGALRRIALKRSLRWPVAALCAALPSSGACALSRRDSINQPRAGPSRKDAGGNWPVPQGLCAALPSSGACGGPSRRSCAALPSSGACGGPSRRSAPHCPQAELAVRLRSDQAW